MSKTAQVSYPLVLFTSDRPHRYNTFDPNYCQLLPYYLIVLSCPFTSFLTTHQRSTYTSHSPFFGLIISALPIPSGVSGISLGNYIEFHALLPSFLLLS